MTQDTEQHSTVNNHQEEHKPVATHKKKLSKTAQALMLVSTGLTHRQAANALGITTQSIYRLQSYRRDHPVCPTCGR
jgi:tRNA(Ile2) C34 agmatinyltransferase TiaS